MAKPARWTIYICADCGEHQHDHNRTECWKCGSGREWEEIEVVPAPKAASDDDHSRLCDTFIEFEDRWTGTYCKLPAGHDGECSAHYPIRLASDEGEIATTTPSGATVTYDKAAFDEGQQR